MMRNIKLMNGFILLPVVFTLAILAAIAYLLSREGAINAGSVNREQQQDAVLYTAHAGYNHAVWQLNRQNCSGYADIPVTSLGDHSYLATITGLSGATVTAGSPVNITVQATQADGASYTLNRKQEKIFQFPIQQLILQPDELGLNDTYLYEAAPGSNYGLANEIQVENKFANSEARSLLKFDLSGLSAKARVQLASLELFQKKTTANAGIISVHRVSSPWLEGSQSGAVGVANWTERDVATIWINAGGDYDANEIASTAISDNTMAWYLWDVTSLVQLWINGTYPNEGLILISSLLTSAYFYSSDYVTDPSLRPRLSISYLCECGEDCTASLPVITTKPGKKKK